MTVRVYLKKEVQNQLGFEEKKDGWKNKIGEFSDVILKLDKGEWYIELNDLSDSVPKVFDNFVQEVSYYGMILAGSNAKREFGVYGYKSAKAEFDLCSEKSCDLIIKSKNMEDAKKLYHLIRGGNIRPMISYEKQQILRPIGYFKNWIIRFEKIFNSIKDWFKNK